MASMSVEAGSNVHVYIRLLHPCTPGLPQSLTTACRAVNDDEEEEEKELAIEVGKTACPNGVPYLVLPNSVRMQGSGTNILFQSGCIDGNKTTATLGEAAWEELWRTGSFWYLYCVSPHTPSEGPHETQDSMLQYMVERIVNVASPLTATVLLWTEGSGSLLGSTYTPSWRRCSKRVYELTDCDTLLRLVNMSLLDSDEEATSFRFSLVSVAFTDPDSGRTYEIVVATVHARFDVLSTRTSNSLVAVRNWFANIAWMPAGQTLGKQNDEGAVHEMEAWAAGLLPTEVTNFIFTHLYNPVEDEGFQFTRPLPPRIVYAILEIHGDAPSVGDREWHSDESAQAAMLRYLEFWSSLGALVLEDDDNTTTLFQRKATNRGLEGVSCEMLNDAKQWLLFLLANPAMAPQLMEEWDSATKDDRGNVSAGNRLLVALEHMHRVVQRARQKGMQRRVRNLLRSDSIHGAPPSSQSSRITQIVDRFGVENQALMWCQRLEWKYYTMLSGFLSEVQRSTRNDVAPSPPPQLQQQQPVEHVDSAHKKEEDTIHSEGPVQRNDSKSPVVVASATEKESGTSSITSHNSNQSVICHPVRVVTHHTSAPLFDPVRRLLEAEAVRRIHIKLNAAQSLQAFLFSSVHGMRCCYGQLAASLDSLTSAQRDIEGLRHSESLVFHRDLLTFQSLVHCCMYAADVLLRRLLEGFQLKLEWFTEALTHLRQQDKTDRCRKHSTSCDAAVQIPAPMLLGNALNQGYGDHSDLKQFLPIVNEALHQPGLEEVSSSTNSVYMPDNKSVASQEKVAEDVEFPEESEVRPEDLLPPPAVTTRAEATTKATSTTTSKGKGGHETIGANGAPASEVVENEKEEKKIRYARRHPVENCIENDRRVKGGVAPSVRFHRLRRLSASVPLRQSCFRHLLSTGRSVGVDKQQNGGKLPALSFDDIKKEREHWNTAGDLDDYRRLLAYSVYVVGEARCGKSSLLHRLSRDTPSSSARPPTVAPHTMTMKRVSAIVDVPLWRGPLPLGGCSNVVFSDVQEWMSITSEVCEAQTCRVGVNFVEMPGPFLLAASMGHVKLPIRGAVYYIVYRMQDSLDAIQHSIWKHVVRLQSAVALPSSHVVDLMKSDADAAGDIRMTSLPLPVVLVGTHADLMPELILTEQQDAAQKRLCEITRWFEQQIEWQTETAGDSVPRPLLVDACLTSACNSLVISKGLDGAISIPVFLQRTLQFLHHTAPLSPLHVLARWLPRRFIAEEVLKKGHMHDGAEAVPTAKDGCNTADHTLEGFWAAQCLHHSRGHELRDNGEAGNQQQQQQQRDGNASLPSSSQTLVEWWRGSLEGLLVLFTALQRLRQYISCSFEEQSLDNAVLYHLGFARSDDPDETSTDAEVELSLRERDVFLESLFEECRLRGVLLFLPFQSLSQVPESSCGGAAQLASCQAFTTGDVNRPLCMVTVGPEWVEHLWAQTLAPRMVVHHAVSALQEAGIGLRDALMGVLEQCVEQLGYTFPIACFAAVWPQIAESASEDATESSADNIDKMQGYFFLYFKKGFVSIALLQLLWRSPYAALATHETNAATGLMACGLICEGQTLEKEEVEEGEEVGMMKSGITGFHVPCTVLTANEDL
ncbi:hypothetical protein DQ04_00161080 [Trypanosoma grayi]|uniref:hypothetical protein n=1 Tax=Trypanosoma grayi TaxID=71804 RepID=UPI0004F44D4B|nr:hypothetical protein DQ04_00161080 [Trypanosoma grayi]KEG15168.1 hypothetical protein DQ04_00161080 [Trypanosoma grayi]